MKKLLLLSVYLNCFTIYSQPSAGKYISDTKTGCRVWVAGGYSDSDSLTIRWDGGCKDNLATGTGNLVWYVKGTEVSRYTGAMQKGDPNGKGKYRYFNGVMAEGNFADGVLHGAGKMYFPGTKKTLAGNYVHGDLLNLDPPYLKKLFRNKVSATDSTDMYITDGQSKDLFYSILVPDKKIIGVLVLLPGTWERMEHVLSSNKELCQLAFTNGIAVIVPSVNQRLTLNTAVLDFLNAAFSDAITRYKLPADKFVLGGFSMGGLFSIRYTEFAIENNATTAVVPKAVYSVDGPTDLANHYKEFQRAAARNPNAQEPKYALDELKKYTGGSPEEVPEKYIYYSTFSKSATDGGNAKLLKNIPVRIYNDVDVNWWLTNRGADLYSMNALDQSAMINVLHRLGNKQAEFINAFGKGYRLEGNRHPHSWSIVDAAECISWIKKCIK
jgi:hypothetical protein